MVRRQDQARSLAERLSAWARTPVTVAWEGEGVGRGGWWVRWSDGPAQVTLRAQAELHARYLRPLDVAVLRWGRAHTPWAWAVALVVQVDVRPEITDWHELLGAAETWLVDADWPDRPVDDATATAAAQLLEVGGDREAAMAQAAVAAYPPTSVTKPRDETS